MYDVRIFGAMGNGVVNDRAAIAAASTAAAATSGAILFPPGTYRVSADLTIGTSAMFEPGAQITADRGVTVTLTGRALTAGRHQIFNGTVLFGDGSRVSEVYPEWWGVVGDSDGRGGGTDDTAAFNACMAAVYGMGAGNSYSGASIVFRTGKFRINTISPLQAVVIRGQGGWHDGRGEAATVIVPDAGHHGLFVAKNTHGGWCTVDGLAFEAADKGAPAHGINLEYRAIIRNFHVRGFSGNGVHIEANYKTGGNANGWHCSSGRVESCDGHGFYTAGTDVNAGYAEHIDCSNNSGKGFFDNSYLGNTYVACHSDGNAKGNYETSNSTDNLSTFVSCYAEQPGSVVHAPAMVVNSRMDAAPESTASIIEGYARTVARRYSLAQAASVALFPRDASGMLVVRSTQDNASAILNIGAKTTIISDPAGAFSTTSGTRSKINVYQDKTSWRIENRRGADRTLNVHFLG